MHMLVISVCLWLSVVAAESSRSAVEGEQAVKTELIYLRQNPPGRVPEIFAAGLISDADYEIHGPLVINPNQREICWAVLPPSILSMSLVDTTWGGATTMPLKGRAVQSPAFSADGMRLYYQCVLEGGHGGVDVWWVDRTAGGWGNPVNAGSGLNSEMLESQPSVTTDGTLYFTGTLKGVGFERGIYRSRLVDGEYQTPELLGDDINTEYIDYCPWVARDESYLLFASSRPVTEEILHLHVSFRRPDGGWSEPVNIHPVLGFEASARFPSVSPDGRFLFFLSEGRVYWVNITPVLELKSAE